MTLTDPKDNQAHFTPKAISIDYTQPLGIKGDERERHCGSQLHRFWNQLPHHLLKKEKWDNQKKFADKLCRYNSDNVSALGRLLILKPDQESKYSLFICGKAKKNSAKIFNAYLWNELDHYRPPYIIRLPEQLNTQDTQQIGIIRQFIKILTERNLYHHYAIEIYKTMEIKNLEEFEKKIHEKLNTIMNSTDIKRLLKLYPYDYFKNNPYLQNLIKNKKVMGRTHIATFSHIYKQVSSNKNCNDNKFIKNYNNHQLMKKFLDTVKNFNQITNIKDFTRNINENDYTHQLIKFSFANDKEHKEFSGVIKYPIGIRFEKETDNNNNIIKLYFFLKTATYSISQFPNSGHSFEALHKEIPNLETESEESTQQFKNYYRTNLKQEESKLYKFVTNLNNFNNFFKKGYPNIFDLEKSSLITWGLIDLVRGLEQPAPIQLIFLNDNPPTASWTKKSEETLPTDEFDNVGEPSIYPNRLGPHDEERVE